MKKIINVVVEAVKFVIIGEEAYSNYAIMNDPILKF